MESSPIGGANEKDPFAMFFIVITNSNVYGGRKVAGGGAHHLFHLACSIKTIESRSRWSWWLLGGFDWKFDSWPRYFPLTYGRWLRERILHRKWVFFHGLSSYAEIFEFGYGVWYLGLVMSLVVFEKKTSFLRSNLSSDPICLLN